MTSEPQHSSFDLWWLGAIIYVLGSVLINLGSNMIRRGHEVAKNKNPDRPKFKGNRWWLGGFIIFGIGNVMNFVAFMFAAQSLLVSLGSIQFIANFVFARYINKEKVCRESIISVCIIIAGILLVVGFGSKTSRTYSLLGIFFLLKQPVFLLWLIFEMILVLVLQSGALYWQHFHITEGEEELEEVVEEEEEPWWKKYRWTGERPAWIDSKFLPLSFSVVSVCIGTQSILLGKMLSGVLLLTLGGGSSAFTTIWPYFMGGLMFVTSAFYIHRLNEALRLYDALFIIPTLQGLWLFFGAIEGGIFFKEFKEMTWWSLFFYACGLLLIVAGVLVLALKKKSQHSGPVEEELRDLQLLQAVTSVDTETISTLPVDTSFAPLSSSDGGGELEDVTEWDEESGRRREMLDNTFCVSVMDDDEGEEEDDTLDLSISALEEELMGEEEDSNDSPPHSSPPFPSSPSFPVSPIKKLPTSHSVSSLPTPPTSPIQSFPNPSLPTSPLPFRTFSPTTSPIQRISTPPSPSPAISSPPLSPSNLGSFSPSVPFSSSGPLSPSLTPLSPSLSPLSPTPPSSPHVSSPLSPTPSHFSSPSPNPLNL